MARTTNEEEYAEKRNAILDVALQLVYSKGYEQMTIQDMLERLQISKGAFYHYFSSKQAVLDALIERIQHQVEQTLLPVVEAPDLPALEKLRRFFPTLAGWKAMHRTMLLSLMQILYADENALFRQKVRALAIKEMSPLLASILTQGVQEGVVSTPYPDQVAELVVTLGLDLGDALSWLLLSSEPGCGDFPRAERIVTVYTDALERIIGAPAGSLPIVDPQMLLIWFQQPDEQV